MSLQRKAKRRASAARTAKREAERKPHVNKYAERKAPLVKGAPPVLAAAKIGYRGPVDHDTIPDASHFDRLVPRKRARIQFDMLAALAHPDAKPRAFSPTMR
ncbi:MAG: hypothetical protein ACREE2_14340 [Stellaceae bacterium]